MRVSYSPGYHAPLPEGHIFPMGKFKGLFRYVTEHGTINASMFALQVGVSGNPAGGTYHAMPGNGRGSFMDV